MIGETIKGTYKIYEVVSKDPFVQVYMGRSLQTNEIVAVEIISKRIFDEVLGITRSEWNQRFRHEMDGLAGVVSPHITRIYDFGDWGDAIFVVSEYVPGKSLKQIIEEQAPLEVEQALDVGRQIADCLEAVQTEKLSHGDLRPANVMVSTGGLVKILEFGISKSFVVEGLMPRALVVMPHYVAPEQGEGETPDVRSDIYALGVMLYEMLTGKLPFISDDPARLILKHIHEPAPSVRASQPDVPSEVEAIVARCLAKRPDDRFQTPAELIGAIAAFLTPTPPAPAEAAVAEKPVTAEVAAPLPAVPLPMPAPPPAEALPTPAPPPAEVPPTSAPTPAEAPPVLSPAPPPPAEAAVPPTPALPAEVLPAPPTPPPPEPTPAAVAPTPAEKRRKPSPILLGAGAAAAVLLVALLAFSLLGGGGEKKAEVDKTASPAVTITAGSPAGTRATAVAGAASPVASATAVKVTSPATATKVVSPAAPTVTAAAKAVSPAAPTATVAAKAVSPAAPTITATLTTTSTPALTATRTKTPTPIRRRVYLPLMMKKYLQK